MSATTPDPWEPHVLAERILRGAGSLLDVSLVLDLVDEFRRTDQPAKADAVIAVVFGLDEVTR
jgi:hypothetical protein